MTSNNPIIAAADGSALGNPGPAGWAWYVNDSCWGAGGWAHGTNNMGELKAVLDLFESTAHVSERPLHVLCDSKYTIDSLTKWMPGWKKKGWKKSDGKPVLNQELMKELDRALTGRDYTFEWVKGHAGHTMNEAADERARAAATAFRDGKKPNAGPGFVLDSASGASAGHHSSTHESQKQSKGASASDGTVDPLEAVLEQEKSLLDSAVYAEATTLKNYLSENFVWVTPAGVSVDCATVVEHRNKAFVTRGEPEVISAELMSPAVALVRSKVQTARGNVVRTSLWKRQGTRNAHWVLHFRQETVC